MPYFGGAGGDEGVKFRMQTSISFTGNWLINYPILVSAPGNLQINQTAQPLTWGAWINQFLYNELNQSGGLTSLTFNDLVGVINAMSPASMAGITSLSLPVLANVGANFAPANMAALTTLSAPALTTIGGNFAPATMAALTTFSVPALAAIVGNFTPGTMAALTTLNTPALTTIGGN